MSSLLKKRNESELQTSPAKHMLNPFEEMERIFENFSTRGWLRPFQWDTPLLSDAALSLEKKIPSVDVIEQDDVIIVNAELPGTEKKDLDVSLTDSTVTIKSSTRHEEKQQEGDYYRCEISKGNYMRTVSLPAYIDEDKAKAKFNNGLLELTLLKIEKSHRRSIKVD